MNLAAVAQLPVVFCCTNNQWAISLPVERQSAVATLASKASAYGMPGRRVDGTDVVAVYRALSEALGAARSGRGPSLLEFLVYRMTPHSSSDDPGRYQPKDWATRAQNHDPFRRLSTWLAGAGLLDADAAAEVTAAVEEEVRAAVRVAEETPAPSPASLTEDVYAPTGSRSLDPPGGRSA
jgi:pyruvate dehydrogenase E1 component alpha subunit